MRGSTRGFCGFPHGQMKKPPISFGGSSENLNFVAFWGRDQDGFRTLYYWIWLSPVLDRSNVGEFCQPQCRRVGQMRKLRFSTYWMVKAGSVENPMPSTFRMN